VLVLSVHVRSWPCLCHLPCLQHLSRACMHCCSRQAAHWCLTVCCHACMILPPPSRTPSPLSHPPGHQPHGGNEPATPPVHAQRGSHGGGWTGPGARGCAHCQVDHQPAGATHTEAGGCGVVIFSQGWRSEAHAWAGGCRTVTGYNMRGCVLAAGHLRPLLFTKPCDPPPCWCMALYCCC
jgi:hypothetical protein